jgi:nucleoside phosphorylase
MEAAGVLQAAQMRSVKVLVVRGVSDPGDHRKGAFDQAGGSRFRQMAMYNAADYAFSWLKWMHSSASV